MNKIPVSIFIVGLLIAGAIVYTRSSPKNFPEEERKTSELPVSWGNLGAKMVREGVIDADKIRSLYSRREGFGKDYEKLLTGETNGKIIITSENAGYLLNLFWALGLSNNNPILRSGNMTNPAYGGADQFASTGGWTLSFGNPMDHYSRHAFIELTSKEEELVEKISKNIFRPCCNNSTYFPDCNHGMAMLGFLELVVSKGISEEEIYKSALTLNSFWFPNNYLTIAQFLKESGQDWKTISPKEILGQNFSSASGYARISAQVSKTLENREGGSGCSVGPDEEVTPRSQSGCAI